MADFFSYINKSKVLRKERDVNMGVISTDEWLLESYFEPIKICEKLISYFPKATPREIYQYLLLYGMYKPIKRDKEIVLKLRSNQVWNVVESEYQKLKQIWAGPEIPIFIFPSNIMSREIVHIYNGKSGLAFRDKLFLFLSGQNSEKEIKAVLTHEYNHVCRLNKYQKEEGEYTLGDSIILEGLAETAVKERYGSKYLAPWTTLYTKEQAIKMWKKYIAPNFELLQSTKKHRDLLYGSKFSYPHMCGYNTGFHIVQQAIEKSNLTSSDLLAYPTDKIIDISCFDR